MRTSRLRFSFLLPLLELVIWVVVVIVPITLIYLTLHSHRLPSGEVVLNTRTRTFTVTPEMARTLVFAWPSPKLSHGIMALNMPGFVGEILTSLPTSWPSSWRPRMMQLDAWRAFIYPFFALPAWWFVGRGIDALIAKEKPRAGLAILGALLYVLFTVLFCGLTFGISREDREGITWPLWGFALWAVLFMSFPAAWLRARRAHAVPADN